jgi:CBS domain-containing protein
MLKATKIEEIMTKNVFYVSIDDTIHRADEIIKNEKVRHVPVLDGKKLVGMITDRTIMEYSLKKLYDYEDEFGEEGYDKITDFRNIMVKNLYVIYPEDSVKKAIEMMAKRKINYLPVVDWKNNLVGILTSTDIFLFFLNKFV